MQEVLVKSFEKVRQLDSSPEVCMLLLRLYKRMADTLGTEMIGVVVLPAILPMLVKGQISRKQFVEMMEIVKNFLAQIESHRLKTLVDDNMALGQKSDAFDFDAIEKSLNKPQQLDPSQSSDLSFLAELGAQGVKKDSTQSFGFEQSASIAPKQELTNKLFSGVGEY